MYTRPRFICLRPWIEFYRRCFGYRCATSARFHHVFNAFTHTRPIYITSQESLQSIHSRVPGRKSYKIFFVKTAGMTTRCPYVNMPLHVENILLVLTFWFISSFLVWLMNLSNFVLNFISSSVTGSSLTVLNKTHLTSISDFNEAMTVSSSGYVFFLI